MDRNSLFVIRREDNIRIELMCGDSCNRNNIVYLPSRFVNENPTLEEAYDGEIPFGLPLASSFKFTLDARMISEEQAEIGAWIEQNESPTLKKPNVWIVRKGNNIIFAGIQQADQVEKYDLIKAECEIQAVGIFKIAMESVRIDNVLSASPTDTDLVYQPLMYDYLYSSFQGYISIQNGRVKIVKFVNFINACFGEIETKYQYYMRNYNLTCTYSMPIPTFYSMDTVNLGYPKEPYFISHIFADDDNALEAVTGAIPELQNKYKQLWNFFDELLKGWSYYAKVRYFGDNISFIMYPVFSPNGRESITETYITADKRELSKKLFNIRASNQRINKNRDEDLKAITANINATSLSGSTSEATCIFGNEPNTVANHYGGNPKKGISVYDISKNEKPPVFGFYYKDSQSLPASYKVSEAFSIIGEFFNTNLDYGFLTQDGKDNYNKNIRTLQSKCIASVVQKKRDTYLTSAKEQKTFTISVTKSRLTTQDIGNDYALNITDIYNQIPFYKHVTIPTNAKLGKVVDKLNDNFVECTFYFQGE